MKDGTTLEIKATTHKYARKGKTPYYRWDVSTQSEMLKGNRPIADYWVFLIASFPRETSRTPRVVQAFDPKNWQCYVVSGEKLRTAGCAEDGLLPRAQGAERRRRRRRKSNPRNR